MTIKKLFSLDNVIVLLITFCIFMYIGTFIGNDLRVHLLQVIKINNGEASYPPNFLYYFLANFFSLFSKDIVPLYISGFTILSFSMLLQYVVTKEIISASLAYSKVKVSYSFIIAVSVSLLLFFPIPDYYHLVELKLMYLGKVTPHVWHNSTIIFLQPFTLLLFWEEYKVISRKKIKTSCIQGSNATNRCYLIKILSYIF